MLRSRTPGPDKARLIGRRVTSADGRRGVICWVEFGSVLRDQLYYLVRLDHQSAEETGLHVIAADRRWARELRPRTQAAEVPPQELNSQIMIERPEHRR
jgi:hypothetical protein